MPSIDVVVPHKLGQSIAQTRSRKVLVEFGEQYRDQVTNLKETWLDNVCTFSFQGAGMFISGTLTVFTDKVRIKANLPMAAFLLKGKIENAIRAKAEEALR